MLLVNRNIENILPNIEYKLPMKKIIILLLLSPAFLKAQFYNELLDHESQWHVTSCFSNCINDVYYTDGDTVHNDLNYKILNGFHYISKTFWLRENFSEKRIYLSYYDGKSRKESLLYDFSLNIGDSILITNPISPFPSNGGLFQIDSIISKELLNGKQHKFFYLSPSPSNSSTEKPIWIEGIGSLSLINSPGGSPNVNNAGKLSCYFNNSVISYSQLDSISDCSFENFLKTEEINLNEIKIYPTFFNDNVSIESTSILSKVVVYNINGNLMNSTILDNLPLQNIDLSFLKSGVYFMLLYQDNLQIIAKRIIKY